MGKFIGADQPGLVLAHYFEAAASGATNTAQSLGYFVAPKDIRVKSVTMVPEAAWTGQATNYQTVSVINLGTAGAGTSPVATLAWSSTAVSAGSCAPKALTVSTTYDDVSEGEVLLVTVVATSSGQAYPPFHVTMTYEFQ